MDGEVSDAMGEEDADATTGASAAAKAATSATGKRRTASAPASRQGKGASEWPVQARHAGVEAERALELAAEVGGEVGLVGALLELVGTEHLTLGHALAAWQREQDRLANRTWRRPGGLVRPAGL